MNYRMLLSLFVIFFSLSTAAGAAGEVPLTAAFVRNNQLWVKEGSEERQLTYSQHVYNPKWSFDGRFIAYIDGDEQGEKSDLYIYDMVKNESYQPYVQVSATDYKWSPNNNQLAYNDQGILNVTKIKNGRPEMFENVSLGVSGFEWFPNGKEFIVSSQSNLLPTGWGPIELFKVAADANLQQEKIHPFFTILTNKDLFAITAEEFKWSDDGKWLSFLAIPTASWSNDSNSLCVITAKGERFQEVGKMLNNQDWFNWAPNKNQLAYISGEGRFLVENKRTTIAEMPAFIGQKVYTPKGDVDLDLSWYSPDVVIVARSKENKEWKEGPVPTMYTSLYSIHLKSNDQKQLTAPKEKERDDTPQAVNGYITWVRHMENEQNNVWIREGLEGKDSIWIKNVESEPVFYIEKHKL
ncbi:translocation protein TolB [Niallia sp. MER 6]|uniref:TolB family protein n=1 Tax=Niallia sp. MER 6 TaxID=2939567 RepID=UPI00203F9AD4|nr:translocation protein TolB [Niallia sp. MER 6]MCM3033591.1 translocation protein TolB [Niallia sp. MER 6]